jgi:hypothetical protein
MHEPKIHDTQRLRLSMEIVLASGTRIRLVMTQLALRLGKSPTFFVWVLGVRKLVWKKALHSILIALVLEYRILYSSTCELSVVFHACTSSGILYTAVQVSCTIVGDFFSGRRAFFVHSRFRPYLADLPAWWCRGVTDMGLAFDDRIVPRNGRRHHKSRVVSTPALQRWGCMRGPVRTKKNNPSFQVSEGG